MYFKNSNHRHKYKTHPTYPCKHLLFQWFINVINFKGSQIYYYYAIMLIIIILLMSLYLVTFLQSSSVSDSSSIVPLQSHGLQLTRLLCPWTSPGKNTGVGSHSLLQGISLTPGSDLGLLHCKQILFHQGSHQGSPFILLNGI